MKNLIFINGTMGVGKTATCTELQKILPANVFLDGDWCWKMEPFVVSEETKQMVNENIAFLLNNFIKCSAYENVIFCWVMHEQAIIDGIAERLNLKDCRMQVFSLVCTEKALTAHLEKDVAAGIRTADVIERSIPRLKLYDAIDSVKIDVSKINAKEAAAQIKAYLEQV